MKRTVLDFGLVGVLGLALVAGCSSTSSSSGSGGSQGNGSGGSSSSGGSNGSGGSSSGSGGTTASGGSTGSGGSSSGSGGGSASGGTSGSSCAAVSADLITDFGSGTYPVGMPYSGAESDLTPPMVTSSGSLVIKLDSGTSTMMYPYAYVGLPFNACADASAYKGVKFNISGTLSEGCTIQFSTVDKEHNTVANNGTCDPTTATNMSCYASAKIFTLSADPTDVTVNFADQTGGGAAADAAVVDPTQILGIQWQLNPPAMGACTAMVTVTNVSFVK